MTMHSVPRKTEPAPTGPSAAAGSVRHARTKQWEISRVAPCPATRTHPISAPISTPIAKIAALSPLLAADAQSTAIKSP